MKACTYTLLVTIVDKAPPSPELLAAYLRAHLMEIAGYAPAAAEVDSIEGTRPLPQTIRLKHQALNAAVVAS